MYTNFQQDEKGEFTLAMGLYENALEALLKVHNKSQGRKKELLREEVSKTCFPKLCAAGSGFVLQRISRKSIACRMP